MHVHIFFLLCCSMQLLCVTKENWHLFASMQVDHHLVYADIGPSLLNTKKVSNTLELDDSRVEYAQINHGLLKKKVNHSESVMNKQPPVPGTSI